MTDDETYVVTPRLLVGDRETSNFESIPVASPREALEVIRSGRTARLPSGAWHLAADVLHDLGLSKVAIADRLHFARTGKILKHS